MNIKIKSKMLEFDEIPYPIEILFLDNENKIIFYKNKKNELMKFDAKKLKLNKKFNKFVKDNFNKVRAEAHGFFWKGKNDSEDVYIGKDTIYDYSEELTVDDYSLIIKILNKKRKLPKEKIVKFINSFI